MNIDPDRMPVFIGPSNAEHAIGWSWRYCRDFARAHGVPILKPAGKPLIRLADLLPAIERAAAAAEPASPMSEDEAAREALIAEIARLQ